jgi:hypothetical protein
VAGRRDGLDRVIAPIDDELLAAVELRLQDVFDVEVPLLDVEALIEPLAGSPLGDVTVRVVAMGTHAGADAAPAQDEPQPIAPEDVQPVSQDLPRTGPGAGALAGLAALASAFTLRQRRDP